MSILDLYRDDIDGRIISVSGGKEYRGPCPVCGGNDRFGVWPQQNNGAGSFFCGRGSVGGNGCGIGGDAVQYLRDTRHYTYKEACDCLGIEMKHGGEHLQYRTPAPPKKHTEPAFVPRQVNWPEEMDDPEKWREHGLKFVDSCHEALLQRSTAIAYLMARGIGRDSIVKYKLGFHHGSNQGEKTLLPSYRPWPSWGLKPETRQGGKYRMIILPAGLVIPCFIDGLLQGITIRLVKPDQRAPGKKYHYVRGSVRDYWVCNPGAKVFVIQEAMLDCIALDEAAGDLVGAIGIGTTSAKPDTRVFGLLQDSQRILGALDFDQPRKNPRTGAIERPGAAAGVWWSKQFPQYRRWPVPDGKDVGEAFAAGVDLRTWVLAGLSDGVGEASAQSEPAALVEHRAEEAIVSQKRCSQTDDVKELRDLLSRSQGFMRIYGGGLNVGAVISEDWSAQYPEKRQRISELLYNSESVGLLIENLADGLYGSANIPG